MLSEIIKRRLRLILLMNYSLFYLISISRHELSLLKNCLEDKQQDLTEESCDVESDDDEEISNGSFRLSREKTRSESGHWQSSKETKKCNQCEKSFSSLRRKHHCKICGMIFCSSCSHKKVVLATIDPKKPSRVCINCAQQLM